MSVRSTPAPSAPGRQSSTAATGLALAGSITTMIANFGTAALVARAGAATAGIFFAATALVAILGNSASLGTMTGLVYFLPTALDGPSPNPRALLRTATGPVAVAGAFGGLALLVGAAPIAAAVADDGAAGVASMLRVLAVTVPAWALTVSMLGATRGLGSMTPTVAINQVGKPLAQLVGLGFLLGSGGEPSPAAIAAAWGWPIVAGAALALAAVWRLGGLAGRGPGAVSRARFWAYTRPRSASTALQIALERVDVVLVSALAGEAAAGVYGLISRFVTAGNFVVYSVAQATSPALRRALARERLDDARRLLQQATTWMVALAWPYFLLVALKPDELISVLNPDFTSGARALTVLALILLVNALAGPIDLTLLMLGRSRESLVATAAALALDIALALLLIPALGLVGAALAWGAAVVTVNGIATVIVDRVGGLRGPSRGAAIAASGAVVAVVPVALLTPSGFGWLVVTGAVAGVLQLGWLVRFSGHLGLPTLPLVGRSAQVGSNQPRMPAKAAADLGDES